MNLMVFPIYTARKYSCKQSGHLFFGAHFLKSVETEGKQVSKYILPVEGMRYKEKIICFFCGIDIGILGGKIPC